MADSWDDYEIDEAFLGDTAEDVMWHQRQEAGDQINVVDEDLG